MRNTIFTFSSWMLLLFFNQLQAQTSTLKDLTVSRFEPPYQTLYVNYSGMEMPLVVNEDTNIRGAEGTIKPSALAPNSMIELLEFRLVGSDRVALKIETNISFDTKVKFTGLLEATENGMAIIEGRKVKLKSGVSLQGSKKKKCGCKGMLYAGLTDPLLQPGRYYLTIEGDIKPGGYVEATEVDICRNTFSSADQKLRAAVEDGYTDKGLKESISPQGTFSDLGMTLYGGEIQIGEYAYKLYDDIKVQGYVNMVGERVIPEYQKNMRSDDDNKIFFRFFVIDHPVPNAFAFPNGMIFVHTGLLDVIENEAQLATVLGHEIAHVTHEHGKERYELTKNTGTFKGLGDGLKDYGEKFVKANLGDSGNEILDLAGDVAKSITPEGIANVIKPQPERESQADRVGVYYAYQAGYDIRESVKLWEKMSELTGEPSFQSKIKGYTEEFLSSPNALASLSSDPLKTLSAVGKNALVKELLDTIYTSHPKAKTRAYDISQLLSTNYKGEAFDAYLTGKQEYEEYLGGF